MLKLLVSWCFQIVSKLLWFLYFMFFPLCLTVALYWGLHYTKLPILLESQWTMPALLTLSAFITGVMAGSNMARSHRSMGMFLLGMLAQIGFAAMVWFDLRISEIYARYLPEVQETLIPTIAMGLPTIGTLGMIFYRMFCLTED